MKSLISKSSTMLVIILICIGLLISPICNAGVKPEISSNTDETNALQIKKQLDNYPPVTGGEYWALLVAVGVYYNHPDQDRPSMLDAVDDLYETLLDSDHWQVDHIKMLKAQDATVKNIIEGLLWLDKMEDSGDISLIYITTHGFPMRDQNDLPLDIPPRDETDGVDEALVTYYGFENWYAIIWDDLLNFFVSMLESQGVCLIIDSCYAGGFNDPPFDNIRDPLQGYTVQSFIQGLTEDLLGQGRVILMSSEESTPSWGSYFSSFLTGGFIGFADLFPDGNADGIVSAEEAFAYAQPLVYLATGGNQYPTIRDLYQGELPITDAWS
jgi:hypothetical protein